MKPTPQITSNQHGSGSFPLTDYSFQPTVEAPTNASAFRPTTRPVAFHKLSAGVFGKRISREHMPELIMFSLISGICAWPIFSAVISMIRLARNY